MIIWHGIQPCFSSSTFEQGCSRWFAGTRIPPPLALLHLRSVLIESLIAKSPLYMGCTEHHKCRPKNINICLCFVHEYVYRKMGLAISGGVVWGVGRGVSLYSIPRGIVPSLGDQDLGSGSQGRETTCIHCTMYTCTVYSDEHVFTVHRWECTSRSWIKLPWGETTWHWVQCCEAQGRKS